MHTFTLPGSGKVVRFGYLDGHKEKRLPALKRPSLAAAMMIRIGSIDGAPRHPPHRRLCQHASAPLEKDRPWTGSSQLSAISRQQEFGIGS